MSVAYKILGQKQPATSYETLYKVPTEPDDKFASRNVRKTFVTNITVCNFSLAVNRTYSIRVVPKNETASDKHLIVSAKDINSRKIDFLPMKLMLSSGDKVEVKLNGSPVVAVSAFGFEVF